MTVFSLSNIKVYSFSLFVLFSGLAVKAQDFTIKGYLTNANKGTITLVPYEEVLRNDSSINIKEVVAKDGTFELKGTTDRPILGKLTFENDKESYFAKIFIEPGILRVGFDITKYPGTGLADLVELNGTKNNELLYTSKERIKEFTENHDFDKAKSLAQQIKTLGASESVNQKELDSLKELSIKLADKYYRNQLDIKLNLYKESKGALSMFFLLTQQGIGVNSGISDLAEQQEFLALADKESRASIYYKNYKTYLSNKFLLQSGMVAPIFSLRNRKGEEVSLLDLRGKIVLIDFWAYYCAPCIQAFPKMKDLYQQYKDKGFEIISISTDLDQNNWKNALDKHQNPWIQVIDEVTLNQSLADVSDYLYNIDSLPTYFLLDKNGRILMSGIKEDEIFKKINEIFKKGATKS